MPPPMQQQSIQYGPMQPQNQAAARGGPPGVNQMPLGGRLGRGGNRSGKQGSVNMNNNRGGGSGARGGRGGMYVNNNNRGGGNAGGNFRNHARGGFGNRDNRRGGSFNAGQQGASFRGGRHNRSARNDSANAAARDSDAAHKKDEPKRTVTDFNLVGLEIQDLHWSWGLLAEHPNIVKPETEDSVPLDVVSSADAAVKIELSEAEPIGVTAVAPSSRVCIYFHTAVTAEDAVPIPHASALPVDSSLTLKKGKRKRADDEEEGGDLNYPEPSVDGDAASTSGVPDEVGRGSAAPSVTETASDSGDWLMAAIGEDDGDGDASDSEHREIAQDEQNQDGTHSRRLRYILNNVERASTPLS